MFAHDVSGPVAVAGLDSVDQRRVFLPGAFAALACDRGVVPADSALDLGGQFDKDQGCRRTGPRHADQH